MRLFLLGTGTILPQMNRNASGILVKIGGEYLLFDIGNGILRQIQKVGVDFTLIRYIFISHLHADHVNDLPVLLKANLIRKKEEKVTIFGPSAIKEAMNGWFLHVYPYLKEVYDRVEIHEIQTSWIERKGWRVQAFPVRHGVEAYGFKLVSDEKVVVYSGDTGYSEHLIAAAKDTDILIHECSYPPGIYVKGHTSPFELGQIASQANVRLLVLTHFYPLCAGQEEKMILEIKKNYSGEIVIGQDLQEFVLD
ncbi:MAG: MBL fold metallo-hydrolase [Candidatus Helarchaeota archaeon]